MLGCLATVAWEPVETMETMGYSKPVKTLFMSSLLYSASYLIVLDSNLNGN